MKLIDFRSDTVTRPTKRMRDAMCRAEVGDDVYGDDETVNSLQKYVAELCGMEAALFVPSGTFCNQLALFTHCNRGDEVILPDECHIVQHEAGSAAIISGVNLRTLPTNNGKIDLAKVESSIRKERDIHYPVTKLICLENAFSDGTVVDLDYMRKMKTLANKYNLKIHLDGARFFNAVTALNCDIKDITENVDSINICLSKGLCAPIGSMLVGKKDFIEEALYKRKIMGGGMRQVGIIAAAGQIAVKEMRLRLVEDHDNARYLAERLDVISGIEVLKNKLDINMVFFKITDDKLRRIFTFENFEKYGILINPEENGLFRFVTHYYITRDSIDETIKFIIKLKEKAQRN